MSRPTILNAPLNCVQNRGERPTISDDNTTFDCNWGREGSSFVHCSIHPPKTMDWTDRQTDSWRNIQTDSAAGRRVIKIGWRVQYTQWKQTWTWPKTWTTSVRLSSVDFHCFTQNSVWISCKRIGEIPRIHSQLETTKYLSNRSRIGGSVIGNRLEYNARGMIIIDWTDCGWSEWLDEGKKWPNCRRFFIWHSPLPNYSIRLLTLSLSLFNGNRYFIVLNIIWITTQSNVKEDNNLTNSSYLDDSVVVASSDVDSSQLLFHPRQ